MTKKQKIWLAVFGAMFLVPEILWTSIIGKFIYYWILGNSVKGGVLNFGLLELPDSNNLVKIIYLVEFFGALLSFIYLIRFYHPKNRIAKYLLLILFGIILLMALCYLLFAVSFGNLP